MLGAVLLSVLVYTQTITLISFLASLSIAVAGFGTILPIAIKSIMTSFRYQAGTASALHGCLTLAAAAFGSFLVALLQKHGLNSLNAMACYIGPVGILVVVFSLFTKKYLK
jgi:hypothetical protein